MKKSEANSKFVVLARELSEKLGIKLSSSLMIVRSSLLFWRYDIGWSPYLQNHYNYCETLEEFCKNVVLMDYGYEIFGYGESLLIAANQGLEGADDTLQEYLNECEWRIIAKNKGVEV